MQRSKHVVTLWKRENTTPEKNTRIRKKAGKKKKRETVISSESKSDFLIAVTLRVRDI